MSASWDDEAYDRDSYKRADFLDELLERLVIEGDDDRFNTVHRTVN